MTMKPVIVGRFCLVCFAFAALTASPALADNDFAPKAKKTPTHAKSAETAPSQPGNPQTIKFSDPYARPIGAGQPSKSDFPPAATGAPKEPAGGVSFGVKWHATNSPNYPYEHVLPTAGAEGSGDTFEGGIKLGF
jgi:hypothetical protein